MNQAATAPDRAPVTDAEFPGPIYWRTVKNYTGDSTGWDATLTSFRSHWNLIPEALRVAMAAPIANAGRRDGRALNIIVGDYMTMVDQAVFGFGRPVSDTVWAGVYMDPRLVVRSSQAHTIIHEFGHHIDFHLHDLWPGAAMTSYVSVYSTFAAVRNRAISTIPIYAYSRTNHLEWFAEAYASQQEPWISSSYLHNICGGSEQSAIELRMAFLASMPMAAYANGRFDALPAQHVPVYVGRFSLWYAGNGAYEHSALYPGTPAPVGEQIRLGSDGILFTGYPWPTFLWEVNFGSGWQTVSGSTPNPALKWTVSSTDPVNPQFRCTATNILGSTTTPVVRMYTTNT